MCGAMLSKSLIQFSIDGWGCVPSLLFDLRPNYGGGNEDNGDLIQRSHAHSGTLSAPNPAAGHRQPMPPLETPGHLLDEAQAGIKIARRNIHNLRYADDTTLKAESKEVTAS